MQSILIIEDEPDTRGLLTGLLTGAGYETVLTADGPSGLQEAIPCHRTSQGGLNLLAQPANPRPQKAVRISPRPG